MNRVTIWYCANCDWKNPPGPPIASGCPECHSSLRFVTFDPATEAEAATEVIASSRRRARNNP